MLGVFIGLVLVYLFRKGSYIHANLFIILVPCKKCGGFISLLRAACLKSNGGGITAATFFMMASNAGIDLQKYAKEKNRENWNTGETCATCATWSLGHLYQKSDNSYNPLIINKSSKKSTECESCESCETEELSTTTENFGTVAFQNTFSEKTGQNVLCRSPEERKHERGLMPLLMHNPAVLYVKTTGL